MLKRNIFVIFFILFLNNCTKVYTGYKFDKFSLEDVKLFSSKEEITKKLGRPTMNIDHDFNLKLENKNNDDKILEKERVLECHTKNCMYYLNSEGYDVLFLRNIMKKYKTLILKFDKNNKLIEKYYLQD